MTPPAKHPTDPLSRIFAYRAIDLRDRFPQPVETFREALECLQSDRAYMAAMSCEIIAYLRGGYSLTIPDDFFIHLSLEIDATLVPPEENDAVCDKVEAWLCATLTAHEKDLPAVIPVEERPYTLDKLLERCDLQSPHPKELAAWQAAIGLSEGDRTAAERWLHKEAMGLGGRRPIDVMQVEPQQVLDLIGRIEHGVYT
ncbi:antitoxin Xre/MbcA/ParS toxin-binding domain-containing protein [Halomonas sp. HK25]|uniref:antitoxin Xre/MbcA/ParS toxin-binding domain-containing protein n=1 Tax=Halomonas sp. HK25 TaxID=3394321 RepID=UPI0039FBD4E6